MDEFLENAISSINSLHGVYLSGNSRSVFGFYQERVQIAFRLICWHEWMQFYSSGEFQVIHREYFSDSEQRDKQFTIV